MSINRWVYEKATGKWLLGFRDPAIVNTDPVNFAIADLGDGTPQPDPVFERFDATTGRRPATPVEIAESRAEQSHAVAVLTSRQKDILATLALIVRARGIPAWNALTTPQKVAATLAEADVWITIRDFLEVNS